MSDKDADQANRQAAANAGYTVADLQEIAKYEEHHQGKTAPAPTFARMVLMLMQSLRSKTVW